MSDRRTTFADALNKHALTGNAAAFKERLIGALTETIIKTSMVKDGDGRPVTVLRLAETISALLVCLASFTALSRQPYRDRKAIRELAKSFERTLRKRVEQAVSNPDLLHFAAHVFSFR
jgi:hypothetical protein